jgi:hypothetical protein
MVSPPPSFDAEFTPAWSLWVLDHGLPTLPETLGLNDSVPVARWVGPRFAAVFHVRWLSWEELDGPAEPDSQVEFLRRRDDGWQVAYGSGGSNWFDPQLRRPELPASDAQWSGMTCVTGDEGWYCCALEGLVGRAATTIEVEDRDGLTVHPIESPLGVALAAFDGKRRATIRIRSSDGDIMLTEAFDPKRPFGIPHAPIRVRRALKHAGGDEWISLTPHYGLLGRVRTWFARRRR